jgi:hypothetical protein
MPYMMFAPMNFQCLLAHVWLQCILPLHTKPSLENPQVFQLIALPERLLHKFEACFFFNKRAHKASRTHKGIGRCLQFKFCHRKHHLLWPPCCPSPQRFKSCRLSEPLAQLLHMLHRLVLFVNVKERHSNQDKSDHGSAA